MKLKSKNLTELRNLLEELTDQYNRKEFIEDDPISIPHRFTLHQDREISGFLISTLAWGQRKNILKSGEKLLQLMEYEPYNFVYNYGKEESKKILSSNFVYRTFNANDLDIFMKGLKKIYEKNQTMEKAFIKGLNKNDNNLKNALTYFVRSFFPEKYNGHALKHLGRPDKGSAAKRLNLFLRWMVRKDDRKVDFGIWQSVNSSLLSLPLDVHSGNIARELGIIKRKQNDWKTVEEADEILRKLDSKDPVKYDYALFGLGVNRKL